MSANIASAEPRPSSRLRRLTRLYGWIAIVNARRGELVVGALFSSLIIAIITAVLGMLWQATIPAGHEIVGYTAKDMVWYIAIAEAAVNGADPRLMVRIGEQLRSGELTIELLRPVTLVWMLLSTELGRGIARFALTMPACCAVAFIMAGPPPSWSGLLLAVLVTGPFAALVQTTLIFVTASSSLWLGDTTAAWFVMQKLVFLFGGMLIPLEFWPGDIGHVLSYLPWAACAYTPAHLAVIPDVSNAMRLIALQVVWFALLLVANSVVWRRGERHLLGLGGA